MVMKWGEIKMDCYIRYADINDSKILGYIHSQSWEIAYKSIIPHSILENMSAEKRNMIGKLMLVNAGNGLNVF